MRTTMYISIVSGGKKLLLNRDRILYVLMVGRNAEIHLSDKTVYETRKSLSELEEELGDSFLEIHRGCIVATMAIHSITDKVYLSNGEVLIYTLRKKKQIIQQLEEKQRSYIEKISRSKNPTTEEEYRSYYKSFEKLPFAFTDIEVIFDVEHHAVDWLFRYGNQALAELEKMPLEQLLEHSFGTLFRNMDSKWLRAYERATLYGETIEIIDYSPEIDTYLKVICFPTFPGHCGCILFDISKIKFIRNSSDAEKALMLYFGKMPE